MDKSIRGQYLSPQIGVSILKLEQCVANSSVSVSGGDSDTPNQPEIEDWNDGGSGYAAGDI